MKSKHASLIVIGRSSVGPDLKEMLEKMVGWLRIHGDNADHRLRAQWRKRNSMRVL